MMLIFCFSFNIGLLSYTLSQKLSIIIFEKFSFFIIFQMHPISLSDIVRCSMVCSITFILKLKQVNIEYAYWSLIIRMISINIIMSVINLNLWINFQVLKSSYEHLSIFIKEQLEQLSKEMINYQSQMTKILLAQIHSRDTQIEKLKQQVHKHSHTKIQNKCINIEFNVQDKQSVQACIKKYKQQQEKIRIERMNVHYQEILKQNKQYQIEFTALVEEMRFMKNYLQELKRAKANTVSQTDQIQSPAKKLAIQQEQQSLNRFNNIKMSGTLDTIRQVTELSAVSDTENHEQKQQFQPKINDFNQKSPKTNPAIQAASFQITNQIQDITNIFFNSSKDLTNKYHSNNQSLQQSLSVLKNYCSKQNVCHVESTKNIVLGCQLSIPYIKIKNVVNQRYILYEEGYVYTGNTIKLNEGYRPMGFGQLYQNNQLVYCGYWKNGVFDGWGKMYLNNSNRIKNYNGRWSQGYASGVGSIKYWNNDKFIGSLKNGQINGQGTLYQGNKTYQGYWENNTLMKQQIAL